MADRLVAAIAPRSSARAGGSPGPALIPERETPGRRGARLRILVTSTLAAVTTFGSSATGGYGAPVPHGIEGCSDGWQRTSTPAGATSTLATAFAPVDGAAGWVVGFHGGADVLRRPMILDWQDGSWVDVGGAWLGPDAGLSSVAARGPDLAWAVGFGGSNRTLRPTSERWDDGRWRAVSIPDPVGNSAALVDVEVVGQRRAWAVGYRFMLGEPRPYAVSWDGSSWRQRDAGLPANLPAGLLGISRRSGGDLWAVGWKQPRNGRIRPLTVRWDGAGWVHTAAPIDIPLGEAILTDVTAGSPPRAWAVGYAIAGSGRHVPIVQRWNGSTWRLVSVPWPSGVSVALRAVAANLTGRVVVAGSVLDEEGRRSGGIVATRDGSAWTVTVAPAGIGARTELRGAGATDEAGWAVGWQPGQAIVVMTCTPPESPIAALGTSRGPDSDYDAAPDADQGDHGLTVDAPASGPSATAAPVAPIGFTARDVASDVGLAETTSTYGAVRLDADSDGRDDLLISRHTAGPARLALARDGSFVDAPGVAFTWSDRHGCAAADIDDDAMADIFCVTGGAMGAKQKANELWLHPGAPPVVLAEAALGAVDPFGRGRRATFLDLDGDPYPDLFITNDPLRVDGLPSPDRLFRNAGGQAFEPAPDAGLDLFVGGACATATDLDLDGLDDLLVCSVERSSTGLGLHVFLNANGTFSDRTLDLGLTPTLDRDVVVGDFDGDRRPDIVQLSPARIRVSLQRTTSFGRAFERAASAGVAIAAGDANGDGHLDLYVARGGSPNGDDLLLMNAGDGRAFTSVALPQSRGGSADDVVTIDHDQNGFDDFLVLNGASAPGPIQLIAFFPSAQ